MQGTTHRHLSDHLSDLVETTVNDLSESKCISVEDDADLGPLNLGMIASYYYIQYTTVEIFASSLTAKSKMKGVLEILSSSSEFSMLTIRQGEDKQLEQLINHLPYAMIEGLKLDDPISKVYILLQAHFSRVSLSIDMNIDLKYILELSVKLLQALIDVISSQGWLKPAIAAMELSQMVVQGMWDKASVLLQIPHMTDEVVKRCNSFSPPVNTIFDIFELEDADRNDLLGFSPDQLSNVPVFCNSYPNVEVTFDATLSAEKGSTVAMTVSLQRDGDDDDDDDAIPVVVCPRFPVEKVESYWLVMGDPSTNTLFCIKRVSFGKKSRAKLQFIAPEDPGSYSLTLYLMSDSYLGCDHEFDVKLKVTEEEEEEEEE
jgi:pre-mRNA-splicing helicase BRR2